MSKLTTAASVRYCADGGANRLHDRCRPSSVDLDDAFLPDLIKGDLDSLKSEVRDYYKSKARPLTRPPSRPT